MAKQKYERKEIIEIIGFLDVVENEYFISVEKNGEIENYPMDRILEECVGKEIKIKAEEVGE